jgi:phospholipid-binding lipoprotein MlaA
VAQVYDMTPLPVKAGTGNFFGNTGDLWIGANSALQGKFGDAGSISAVC